MLDKNSLTYSSCCTEDLISKIQCGKKQAKGVNLKYDKIVKINFQWNGSDLWKLVSLRLRLENNLQMLDNIFFLVSIEKTSFLILN